MQKDDSLNRPFNRYLLIWLPFTAVVRLRRPGK